MAPKSQSSKRSPAAAGSGSFNPPEALRQRYHWVAFEVLATLSLMSEADVARLELPAVEGCVYAPAGAEEPVCSASEEGKPNFFYFYREVNTRVQISFPFSAFQISALSYLHLAPSQLHPNGWAYLLAFEKLCGSYPIPIPCTTNLFFYYFCPFTPGSAKEGDKLKGLVSLRNVSDRKLMGAFSDSFKRFKSAFYKVVAVPGQQPWFLDGAEGPGVKSRFPLYWDQGHYKKLPTAYLVDEDRLLPDSVPHVPRLAAFVEKYGVHSAASFISGDASEPLPPTSRSMDALPTYFRLSRATAAPSRPKKRAASADAGPSSAPAPKKGKAASGVGASSASAVPKVTAPEVPAVPAGTPAPTSSAAAAARDVPAPAPEAPALGEGASVDLSPALEGRDKVLSDDEILASLSLPGSPKESTVPIRPPSPLPTGPSSAFPRGFLWEQGLVEEVDIAFLPPRHFLGGSTSLSSDAEDLIREAQLGLIRSVGYLQAYRMVRNQYGRSKAEIVKLKKVVSELESQASASGALKEELAEVKKRASSSEDELILAWNDRDEALAGLKAAKADAAKALAERDGALAERDAAKAAVVDAEKELALSREQVNSVAEEFGRTVKELAEALAVVTSLEKRLADLTGEKLAVEEALAAEKAASKGLADDMVQTAEACFSQALLQIQHFNPGVKLELEGYSHRAYVMADGSFIPATDDPATDAEEPAGDEADAPEVESAEAGPNSEA